MNNNLEEIAKDKGIKHIWIAQQMGVSHTTIVRWMHHDVQPSARQAIKLADLLGVDIKDIWG